MDPEDPKGRALPLAAPADEDWYWYSPSEAGKALRVGLDWLLDNVFTKFADLPKTSMHTLEALHWMERALEVERTLLIVQARVEGASWTDIARRIGLSKQAVHHRYREHVERLTALFMTDGYSNENLLDYIDAHFDAWADQGEPEAEPGGRR